MKKCVKLDADALSSFQALFRPDNVVCVGPVSDQTIKLAQQIGAESIRVLEPDTKRLERLKLTYQNSATIQFEETTFSDSDEEMPYFRANIEAASGFVPPDLLSNVWANVAVLEQLAIAPDKSTPFNYKDLAPKWVFLDRLDLTRSIDTVSMIIQDADLVISRRLDDLVETPGELQNSFQLLDRTLIETGFVYAFDIGDPRYRLKRSVWIRNWKSVAEKLHASAQAETEDKTNEALIAKQNSKDLSAQLELARAEIESLRSQLSETHSLLMLAQKAYRAEKEKT